MTVKMTHSQTDIAIAFPEQDMVNDMIGKLQADTEAARARMIKITPSLEAVDSRYTPDTQS